MMILLLRLDRFCYNGTAELKVQIRILIIGGCPRLFRQPDEELAEYYRATETFQAGRIPFPGNSGQGESDYAAGNRAVGRGACAF